MKKKIEVVKQASQKDCGPASLLSIIKYYNGYVPLEKIKIDAKTDYKGTTAYNLIKAGNNYGFDASGYKYDKDNFFNKNINLPVICHVIVNGLNHFIVLYEYKNNNVIVMDPACGKKILSKETFIKEWTGTVLHFYPRNKIVILKSDNKIFTLLLNLIKYEKKLFISLIVCSIFYTILVISSSFYFKIISQNMNKDLNYIKFICLFFLIITLLKCLLKFTRTMYETYLNKNLDTKLFSEFINHILRLPSKVIASKSVGEIITRFSEIGHIKTLFIDIIISMSLDFILMLTAIPILFIININLFIILLLILIIYLIVGLIFSKIIYKSILLNKEYHATLNTKVIESVTMLNNIKNLDKVNVILKQIEYSAVKYIHNSFSIGKINNLQNNIKYFTNEVGFYLINTVGFYQIYNNHITIEDLITFNLLTNIFFEPIKNLIDNIPKYNGVKASIFKLNEFMNIEGENELNEQLLNNWDIDIKNIMFGYNDFSNILENYSINIKEGKHIFLSGKSGSGKSSLCKLLLKHEDNYQGEIIIGGINIKDLTLKTIRKNIMYVSQREHLYTDTLRNNIEFFTDYDLTEFDKICKLCNIDEILKNKLLRYDSFLEMDTNNFSGGEKQRIVLARACMNNFKVLIIDEALSEVDLETELNIIKNLKKYFFDKTIIYISHKDLSKQFKEIVYV